MRFAFTYLTNRWMMGPTTIHLEHTPEGWRVDAIAHTGDCDRTGAPMLYSNFDQDSVAYPHKIGRSLEWAWEQIADEVWDHAVAQKRLQELAEWVTACETAEPRWPGWN